MSRLPLLVAMNDKAAAPAASHMDQLALEPTLPAAVAIDSQGMYLARQTRLTEVAQETHDDK